jgi:hypothetical protein
MLVGAYLSNRGDRGIYLIALLGITTIENFIILSMIINVFYFLTKYEGSVAGSMGSAGEGV